MITYSKVVSHGWKPHYVLAGATTDLYGNKLWIMINSTPVRGGRLKFFARPKY